MGERNCAIEGCNALEFRASGYCLRHKDDHPWLAPPEPALEFVAQSKEEWKKKEEEIWGGPFGWLIALTVWFFPPILLLLIPIYMFTSKEDKGPGDEDLDANSRRDEDTVVEDSDEVVPEHLRSNELTEPSEEALEDLDRLMGENALPDGEDVVGENSAEPQLPWWVIEEEPQE